MYTASIWSGIPQLIETTGAALEGRRILMYSYGSGISASMFSLVGRTPSRGPRFSLARLQGLVSGAGEGVCGWVDGCGGRMWMSGCLWM